MSDLNQLKCDQSSPSAAVLAKVEKRIDALVMEQANPFIRALVKGRVPRMGNNRAELRDNILDAARSGNLTLRDIDDWLDDVEGWGDQSIYLYRLPATEKDPFAGDVDKLRQRLEKNLEANLWDAKPTKLVFPRNLELTRVDLAQDSSQLTMVWYQALAVWKRDKSYDFEQNVDGDDLSFEAYRERVRRAVMRLEVRRLSKQPLVVLVGLFISSQIKAPDHRTLKETAFQELEKARLLKVATLEGLPIEVIIRKLDWALVNSHGAAVPGVQTLEARLSDSKNTSAWVEFEGKPYWDSTALVGVRSAARNPRRLEGASARFDWALPAVKRPAKVELDGEEKGFAKGEIHLSAQLDANAVWSILETLAHYV